MKKGAGKPNSKEKWKECANFAHIFHVELKKAFCKHLYKYKKSCANKSESNKDFNYSY